LSYVAVLLAAVFLLLQLLGVLLHAHAQVLVHRRPCVLNHMHGQLHGLSTQLL
jgi:hypothetical protein